MACCSLPAPAYKDMRSSALIVWTVANFRSLPLSWTQIAVPALWFLLISKRHRDELQDDGHNQSQQPHPESYLPADPDAQLRRGRRQGEEDEREDAYKTRARQSGSYVATLPLGQGEERASRNHDKCRDVQQRGLTAERVADAVFVVRHARWNVVHPGCAHDVGSGHRDQFLIEAAYGHPGQEEEKYEQEYDGARQAPDHRKSLPGLPATLDECVPPALLLAVRHDAGSGYCNTAQDAGPSEQLQHEVNDAQEEVAAKQESQEQHAPPNATMLRWPYLSYSGLISCSLRITFDPFFYFV